MKMEHWSQGLAGDEPLDFGLEVFSLSVVAESLIFEVDVIGVKQFQQH